MAQYDGPKLFLGHVMMRGSKTSTGQELVGCDLELGLDDLALVGADFYGLGHIHMHQRWATPDAPVFYPGSPRRCNFGEAEPKGFIVADLVDDEVQWSFVETPARRMVTLDYSFDGELHPVGSTVLEVLSHVSDTEFRLRYRVPADQRDAAKTAVEKERQLLLENGAHSVKVEPQIIATTRARAPEVATAQTLTEKLEALWAARNDVPEPERGERLLGKARTLEESHAV